MDGMSIRILMDASDRHLYSDWLYWLIWLKSLCVVRASGIAGFSSSLSPRCCLLYFSAFSLCWSHSKRFFPRGNKMLEKHILPVEKESATLIVQTEGRIYSSCPWLACLGSRAQPRTNHCCLEIRWIDCLRSDHVLSYRIWGPGEFGFTSSNEPNMEVPLKNIRVLLVPQKQLNVHCYGRRALGQVRSSTYSFTGYFGNHESQEKFMFLRLWWFCFFFVLAFAGTLCKMGFILTIFLSIITCK